MPLTLDQLNAAPPAEAEQMLDGLFEHTPWIAQQALAQRPFQSLAHLKHVMAEVLAKADGDQQLALIRAGGPYPYRQDDGVFGNREGLLPRQPSGYYREYTVVTPGSDDRGPRRIISGADGDRYWTADHYASFRQIKEGR